VSFDILKLKFHMGCAFSPE